MKCFIKKISLWLFSLLKKIYYKYYYYIFGVFYTPKLSNVAIEINSWCNRKCKFCPNYYNEKEKAILDESLFYKIVKELKDMKFKGALTFSLFNEPLLHPKICKFIEHIRTQLPSAFIYLNTNGDCLTLDLWKELRVSGLNYAHVTQYDVKINQNIQQLLNALKPEETNHIKVHLLGRKFNRAGLVQGDYVGELPLKKFCNRPFYQLCINYKGKVVLCCNDYFGLVEIADVYDETISEIWANKILKYYRKKLSNKDRNGLRLCDKCDMG